MCMFDQAKEGDVDGLSLDDHRAMHDQYLKMVIRREAEKRGVT